MLPCKSNHRAIEYTFFGELGVIFGVAFIRVLWISGCGSAFDRFMALLNFTELQGKNEWLVLAREMGILSFGPRDGEIQRAATLNHFGSCSHCWSEEGTQDSGLHSIWRDIWPGKTRPSANPCISVLFYTWAGGQWEGQEEVVRWGLAVRLTWISSEERVRKARAGLREGWGSSFFHIKGWGWVLWAEESGCHQMLRGCASGGESTEAP